MTDAYDCYPNALAKRINGILKMEFLINTYDDASKARKVIEENIHIYNYKRPHLSFNMKTPQQVHQQKNHPYVSGWFLTLLNLN